MEKMSNNNNDIGNVMKSQGYYVPTPSIPSPMPSKDNISSIPIPVGMRGSSDMDNDVLSREGSRSIPSLVEGIKNSVETSYHDDVKARNPLFQMINETGIPKGNYDITGSRINLRDSRYRLSTGEWIPKYESYINNVDNDDRLSRSQSGWEKTYRGLGKFIYKSALYGIGGVGQSVYGLKELVTKGTLSAMYDNSFARWLDDMDKRGDYTLNHYYSKEERDAGFLKSMFTTNFWTNDLLSGAAFTAGAVLSSYAFAGAGLMNAARMGARIGATIAGMGKAVSATKTGFNAMLRAARIGRGIGKGLDNLTFIGTSTLWEASVESRSGLMESEENFKQAYRNAYGREASYEELMKFRADNADAANAIFAANIGILTLSNIAMFGDMFGMDLGVDKFIKRNIFGVGAERMDNGTLRIITPKKWQKIAGNTFNIIKRPVSEGLYEEGLQGVASKSAEDWVESRYNPMAIRQNIGYMEAIKNGFKETYGSNQGWKEIGIGMIIGSFMGVKTIGGIKEWSQDMSRNKGMVEAYNTNAGALTTAAIRAIRGSMALNAQLSGVDTSYESDGRIINKDFSDAVFNRLRYDSEMGMLDDTKENFRTVVESIPNSDIASDMNMTDEQVNEYKADLVNEFNKKVDNFIMASRFADSLTDGISNRSFNAYISNMAYNGLEAKDNLNDIANQLRRIYNTDIGPALDIYSRLNPDSSRDLEELRKLTDDIQRMEKNILRLQQSVASKDALESDKAKLVKENDRLLKLTEDRIALERKLTTLINSEADISKLFLNRNDSRISAADLMAAYDTIADFENVVSIRGVDNYKEAMALLSEYRHNLVAYKNINESLRRMRDRRFIRAQERGFMKILSNVWGKTYEEDDSKYDFRNTDNPDANDLYANDQAIDKAYQDGLIGEDEAFMFKTYNHMIARSMENEIKTDEGNIVERVPDDEDIINPSDDRINNIAIKIWNGNEDVLSPRERQIYDNNKPRVDSLVNGFGDNPISRINKARSIIDRLKIHDNIYDNIKDAVDDIVDMNINGLDQDQIKEAIKTYNDLMNEADNGNEIDQDKLNEAIDIINNYSDGPLLQFVEWMRLYDNGSIAVKDYDKSIPMGDVLTESEPGTSTGRTEVNAAQNPVVLMAQKREIGGVMYYEVGGMRLDRFMDSLGLKRSDATDTDNGRVMDFTNGTDIFTVIESDNHSRWMISEDDAQAFENATGVILGRQTALSTSIWFMVYRKGQDGSIVPYYTGDTFGSNNESVNQEAVANLRKDNIVRFKMDMSDPYTKELYDKYNSLNAVDPNSDETKSAYRELVDNMVIKIVDGDGNFVSVLKANDPDSKGSNADLRSMAFELYRDNVGSVAGEIDIPFVGTVTSVLPGRPNFSVSDDNGTLMVSENDFTNETVGKVESVGYIENGEVTMRDDIKYNIFPFCTAIVRDKYGDYKNSRIPVVAIKTGNGRNYLYPVRLKNQDTSSFSSMIGSMADRIIEGLGGGVSIDDIMDLNNAIARSGLDNKTYMIPLAGDVDVIKGRLEAVKEAASKMPMTADVRGWIGDSRTKEDILMNDVTINIDLNNDPFIAPKFRMSIRRDETFFEDTETPFVNPSSSQSGSASPTKAAEDKSLVSDGNVVSGENEAENPC
nr:MAG TPA: Structural protein [Caudoviricetes sp.]